MTELTTAPGLSVTGALDTVTVAAQSPDTEQPWAALGLKPDEYQRIRDILGRRPTSSELAMYSVMWSEHCSYKSSKVHLRRVRRAARRDRNRQAARGHRRERRRRRHRPGLGRDLQGREPQPPELRRALPGRGHRRRRHRARHHGHGRAPGRGHGFVAVRRDRPPGHPSGRARDRGRRRGLRQLPWPAQHRRRGRLRPLLPRQSTRQRLVRRRVAARGSAPGQRDRRGQPRRALRRAHRRRRHRRRQRAGLGDVRRRRAGQAAIGAGGRSLRREGAHRVLPRALRRPSGRGHPGPRWRRIVLCDKRTRLGRRWGNARLARSGAVA